MDLRIDPASATSPSRQIVEGVLDAIAAGALRPGDRLPSVRGLAAEVLVNPNTVGKAYRDLESLGVVAPRIGDGVFVTSEGPDLAREERLDATLAALRDAARAALRAGHPLGLLLAEIGRTVPGTISPHSTADVAGPRRRTAAGEKR
jgi:GntR family transcriptional regulator